MLLLHTQEAEEATLLLKKLKLQYTITHIYYYFYYYTNTHYDCEKS